MMTEIQTIEDQIKKTCLAVFFFKYRWHHLMAFIVSFKLLPSLIHDMIIQNGGTLLQYLCYVELVAFGW